MLRVVISGIYVCMLSPVWATSDWHVLCNNQCTSPPVWATSDWRESTGFFPAGFHSWGVCVPCVHALICVCVGRSCTDVCVRGMSMHCVCVQCPPPPNQRQRLWAVLLSSDTASRRRYFHLSTSSNSSSFGPDSSVFQHTGGHIMIIHWVMTGIQYVCFRQVSLAARLDSF